MLGSPSLARSMALLLAASASACGLRSDPLATSDSFVVGDDDDGPVTEGDDPNRPGTCNNPLELPFSPRTITGTLSGVSHSEGWCGSDSGPEDAYTLVPDYDVDVLLSLDPVATDFTPTLRVIESGCDTNTGITRICTQSILQEPFHFLAEAGKVYTVIIDSRDGDEGTYALKVDLGEPPVTQCPLHPEVIEQMSGSTFLWNNEFSQGQGRVDGYCGGPGRENMFRLVASNPGTMIATVQSTGGFAPVLSMRTGCAALSELACSSEPAGAAAVLEYFIPQPGQYYLVVDQGEIGAGGYSLQVQFE